MRSDTSRAPGRAPGRANGRDTGRDTGRRSPLGLTDGKSRTVGANLAWTPKESLTFYVDGGYQKMRSKQLGQARPNGVAWELRNEDEFWNAGIGGPWQYSQTRPPNAMTCL